MQRQHSFLIAVVGLLVVFAAVTTARGWAAGPAPTQLGQPVSMPESVAEMQHHFLQVTMCGCEHTHIDFALLGSSQSRYPAIFKEPAVIFTIKTDNWQPGPHIVYYFAAGLVITGSFRGAAADIGIGPGLTLYRRLPGTHHRGLRYKKRLAPALGWAP